MSPVGRTVYNLVMVNAIKAAVTIQPGGRIEFVSTDLPEGEEAEVIILVASREGRRPIAEFLGAGRGAYDTVEDANRTLREERDAWD